MSIPIHVLAQQLTGKPTIEECSVDEARRLAQRYPYFAPAQFLLLQKLRQSNRPEEADAQYKKAVLFYPDPCAFELFISSGKFYGGTATEPMVKEPDDPRQTDEVIHDELLAEQPSAAKQEPEAIVAEAILTADDLPNSNETIKNEATAGPVTVGQPLEEMTATGENPGEPGADKQSNAGHPTSPEDFSDESPPAINKGETEAAAEEPLAFEPYYTVDYFASQGIKIAQEELPKDKLGKQLKSFTEWLKTMKRLPGPQAANGAESLAEKGIEGMANHSVSESEVLTEAMAEVWTKQGVPQKALDIYNKLSLHDPSKRDYFAAKIENLKQS